MAKLEPHERVYRSKKTIFVDNLIGGIAWGLGATLGIALIFASLSFILKNIDIVPYVGSFVADVIKEVVQKNPQLVK